MKVLLKPHRSTLRGKPSASSTARAAIVKRGTIGLVRNVLA